VRAFEAIGGVPELVVQDNARTAIVKASFYDPEVNRTYAETVRVRTQRCVPPASAGTAGRGLVPVKAIPGHHGRSTNHHQKSPKHLSDAPLRAGRVAALQAPLRSIARLAALSLAAPASVIEVGHRANFVIIWSEVNGTIGGTIVSKYREIDVRGTRAHSLTYTVSARIHDPYHRTTIFICRHGLPINFQIETG
jgi:hypothetical protein